MTRIAIVGAGIAGPAGTSPCHREQTRRERVFDATLSLERRPASDRRRVRLRYPAQTLRVLALIYARGARLALRGAPYHPHPRRAA
jgi:uncharacterized protein